MSVIHSGVGSVLWLDGAGWFGDNASSQFGLSSWSGSAYARPTIHGKARKSIVSSIGCPLPTKSTVSESSGLRPWNIS